MCGPRSYRALLILLVVGLVPACKEREASAPSPELQTLLANDARAAGIRPVEHSIWTEVRKFYEGRQQKLAWSTEDGPTDRATSALETLRAAEAHGLVPSDYEEGELAKKHQELSVEAKRTPARAQDLAQFDVRVTTALLELARHVASGRLPPTTIDPRWNVKRDAVDIVAALEKAWGSEVTGLLDAVRPPHPEYAALQTALGSLRGQKSTGWPAVPRASLTVGEWNPAVVPLRKRLAASGYLPAGAANDSQQFDAGVEAAVRAFQEHHAQKPTGKLDPPTLTALNIPLDERIAQVALNMERWRWMPETLGARHLLVNIPYFHLIARENGKPVLDIRVVVGKRGDETPTFSDEMTHVVFSPYWNVPDSIALEETAPAVARDPNYLSRNNMEVVNAAGRVIPESAIPWGDTAALSGLSFRQRPGASNALGLVKFMFPNRHSVYLHDTPADDLFRRIGRAFSHGCVRVEEPEGLAKYVLRDQPEWTSEAIHAAMRAGQERHVKLLQAIPVHIVYFTTWVDPNGGLHFQPDVYGYDGKQARART